MDFLEKYGIKINNNKLLETALTHSSYANENKVESYERLEFLGDAVLEVIISEYLYTNTKLKEGIMSRERANYVCEDALAYYVKQIGYDKYIKLGNGMIGKLNNTIIADTFESVLAVIYLESGFEMCKKYINDTIIPHIKKDDIFFTDYKTILQEMIQTDRKSLEYIITDSYGEAHDMTYAVNVLVDGIVIGSGIGKSKKEAEQNAAKNAIEKSAK